MNKGTVISLCDYTGIMVMPWVKAGYSAVLVDPQHEDKALRESGIRTIAKRIDEATEEIARIIKVENIVAVFGFPVCTDLAVSGAAHWQAKREKDIHFQAKAMQLVNECRMIGELSGAPWFIENPISAISTIWRKPDHTFHPYEYGGYLPENDQHPQYPEYIKPRDAYPKKTCLWVGNGFVMPKKRKVDCEPGYSDSYKKLGGKSMKTKNIRSATPRSFAQAVFEANSPKPALTLLEKTA